MTGAFHTFGDSHSGASWAKISPKVANIIIHPIGAKLMYSFGNEKLGLLNIKDYGVAERDVVCFCFGEIDCRCHVHKYREFGYELVIGNLVKNYIKAIKNNIKQYDELTVCVYNVVPTVRKAEMWEHPSFPFVGEDSDRKKYVKCMNKLLAHTCSKNGFVFFDVYNDYCDKDGFLRADMSDGNVHIQNPIYMMNFIEKWIK